MPKQHPVSCIDSADSPLVFYGPPHRLSGSFRLENASLEKVKLRTLALRSTTLKDSVNSPLTRLQVNSHVGPEERASVPAFMEVDPNTPPGVYDAEFEIGGRFQKIEAHVVETVNLLLQPESITLVAGTEDSFEREILVENAGNIPLALGGECQAPLIRSTDLMTSFREALRKTKEVELKAKIEKVLDEFGEQHSGFVTITRKPVTLKPGQKSRVSLQFTLPDDFEPCSHFRTRHQLYNASLKIDIYTTSKSDRKKTSDS